MDTNQRTANNYQINTFTKGMNSDTSYDMIGADQYLFGQNIRITNNTLLFGNLDSNNTEMVVAPVPVGDVLESPSTNTTYIGHVGKILAVDSIGDIGVVIVKLNNTSSTNNHWELWKITKKVEENQTTGIEEVKLLKTKIYTSAEEVDNDVDRFSTTMIRETEGVVKLYIADGKHPMTMLFIENSDFENGVYNYYYNINDDRYLSSNSYFPVDRPTLSKISGSLKTQQVQYTYRYYCRYGASSRLCPLTNKIQIVGTNRTIETGMAEDTLTDIGMQLRIPVTNEAQSLFQYIQIFRISFIKPGQVPQINLICDKKLVTNQGYFTFDDTGVQELQQYSLEEFSALQEQTLIPEVLEQNQNYMFIANTKDSTTIDDSLLSGYSASLSFVTCDVQLDNNSNSYDNIPVPGQYGFVNIKDVNGQNEIYSLFQYFTDCGVDVMTTFTNDDIDEWRVFPFYGVIDDDIEDSGTTNNSSQLYLFYSTKLQKFVFWDISNYEYYSAASDSRFAGQLSAINNSDWCTALHNQDYPGRYTPNLNKLFRVEHGILINDPIGERTFDQGGNSIYSIIPPTFPGSLSYDNIFVSSLLRSLRYGQEKYQYGIVYYDKYGNHSDVQPLTFPGGTSGTPNTSAFSTENGKTIAKSLGLNVDVTIGSNPDIVGFQLVRSERSFDYVKNIVQVALSRPMRQGKYMQETYRTPYYPNIYLSSQFFYTYYGSKTAHKYGPLHSRYTHATYYPGYSEGVKYLGEKLWGYSNNGSELQYFDNSGTNVENHSLYQIFSPEINIERNNVLSRLSGTNCNLVAIEYAYEDRTLSQSVNSLSYGQVLSYGNYLSYAVNDQSTPVEKTQETFAEYNGMTYTGYCIDLTSTGTQGSVGIIYIPKNSVGKYSEFVKLQDGEWHMIHGDLEFLQYWTSGSGRMFDIVGPQSELENKFVSVEINGNAVEIELVPYAIFDNGIQSSGNECKLCISLEEGSVSVGDCLYSINDNSQSVIQGAPALESDLESGTPIDFVYDGPVHLLQNYVYLSIKQNQIYKKQDKISQNTILKLNTFYDTSFPESVGILHAADVKNPNWDNGFSDIQLGGSGNNLVVKSAIKQYKSYTTSIGGKNYNNWASNGMYDMAASKDEAATQLGSVESGVSRYVFGESTDNSDGRRSECLGWIGPGPVCLLVNTENPGNDSIYRTQIRPSGGDKLGTIIANIQHSVREYDSRLQPYYGFGNFFKIVDDGNGHVSKCVFDGEMYPMFAEFTNLFKTYDFNDKFATIPSGQIVYYIPLESRINTYFDYGCNYRNTQSKNLMLEPGQITGVATQSRPLHQYNMVYSDNDNSIDVFYASPEKKPIVDLPQRICYSQLKTNGENVDSFQIFKPADFIDTDSRYGQVTNLLASDNSIYFWQTGAFGKLSVNERSLVTDNSGETIQLGQGGVLQRVDYMSTKYGMRKQDFCAINTEDAIYWIDILNKAILMCKQNQIVNYGEALNVQNYINSKIILDEPSAQQYTSQRPTIAYDLQTNELLCQAFDQNENTKMKQLVFNTKLGIAQSVYTRQYDDVMYFNNELIAIQIKADVVKSLGFTRINQLQNKTDRTYLSPTILEFSVNSSASQTKVFDNQKVVTLKVDRSGTATENLMPSYLTPEHSQFMDSYFTNKTYSFETDVTTTTNKPVTLTDREGNICYAFPRTTSINQASSFDNETSYGGRMRGKWLRERITDSSPKSDYCISHIITKFRQSYS